MQSLQHSVCQFQEMESVDLVVHLKVEVMWVKDEEKYCVPATNTKGFSDICAYENPGRLVRFGSYGRYKFCWFYFLLYLFYVYECFTRMYAYELFAYSWILLIPEEGIWSPGTGIKDGGIAMHWLGNELGSFERTASALRHWVIPPAPIVFIFWYLVTKHSGL